MSEPIFWAALALVALAGGGARLVTRRPLWSRRASALRPWELVLAGTAMLVLVFHCGAMFFPAWVDVVPFSEPSAVAVRELGTVSQVAYWLPALAVVAAFRRVWLPALSLLVVTLAGVGVTMFWSFSLITHLGWLAAAVVLLVAISSGLVARRDAPAAAVT